MKVAIYNIETGAIVRMVECHADNVANQCGDGESYKLTESTVDDEHHYIDVGVEWHPFVERVAQEYSVTVSELTATITGLVPGTLVQVDGADVVVDDEPTEIEFDAPGIRYFMLSGAVPFIDEQFEVDVHG